MQITEIIRWQHINMQRIYWGRIRVRIVVPSEVNRKHSKTGDRDSYNVSKLYQHKNDKS